MGVEETKTQEKVIEKIAVVNELPSVNTRIGTDKDGNEYTLVTTEEALTEILTTIRDIKKLVG